MSSITFIPTSARPSRTLANMLAQNDAALLIGDHALKFMEENEQPNAETQKPLAALGSGAARSVRSGRALAVSDGPAVCVCVLGRARRLQRSRIVDTLKASRDFGVANIPTIAESYSEPLQIKKEFIQEYLEKNVHYYMDQACLEALQLFYEKAAKVGAIKSARSLQFV